MLRLTISLTFLFCFIFSFSQVSDDWEKILKNGVKAYEAGEYEKAISLTQQASKIMLDEGMTEVDPSYSTVHTNLGMIYQKKGDFPNAEKNYKKSLEIIKKAKSHTYLTSEEKGFLEQAYLLGIQDLASLYKQMGKYKEADALLKENTSEGTEVTTNQTETGRLYQELTKLEANNNFKDAISKAEEIIKLQKEKYGIDHPNYAKAITRLGILKINTSKYNVAESLFEKASQIYLTKFGELHPDYATSLNNLASLYTKMGRYKEAEKAYSKNILITEKVYGKQHIEYGNSLNNLATLFNKTKNNDYALKYALESMEIIKNVKGKKSKEYINSLNTLGGIYSSLGQLNKAEQLMNESLKINEKQYGKNNVQYAATLNNIGNNFSLYGQNEMAEKYIKQSLEVYKNILGEKHKDYLIPLFNYAKILFKSHKDDEAEKIYLDGIYKIHNQIKLMFPGLSDNAKTSFYRMLNNRFDDFNTFAIYRMAKNPFIIAEVYNNQLNT